MSTLGKLLNANEGCMNLSIFSQIECFSFRGTKFTLDPLLIVVVLLWMASATNLPFVAALLGVASYLFIITMHEFGHALASWACRVPVYSVNLHWFGGSCSHGRAKSHHNRAFIASGGILMQLLIAATTSLVLELIAPSIYSVVLFKYLVGVNLFIAAFNLLPIPSLDGYSIFKYLKAEYKRRRYK